MFASAKGFKVPSHGAILFKCDSVLPPANVVCEGYVLQVSVCQKGRHAWWGAYIAGGCTWQDGVHGREGMAHPYPRYILQDTVNEQAVYTSYWNVFLFKIFSVEFSVFCSQGCDWV